MVLLIILIVIVVLVLGLITYARWNYGVLEKLGLPVDKPHFILGNTVDAYSKVYPFVDIEKFKRLGPVYGVYEGREPQIHICDAELIRLITSKDSEYFNDKRRWDFKDPLLNEMPDFQEYEKWKLIRSALAPAFSISKIKLMSESMKTTIMEYTKDLKEIVQSSPKRKLEKYDLQDAIFVLLTDMISRSCFSVKIDNHTDKNNHFVQIVRNNLSPENIVSRPILESFALSFPLIGRFLPGMFSSKGGKAFREIFLQMMETRRQSGEKRKDIVDLCIEWIDKLHLPEYKAANVTEQTVIMQALAFFFAGQDNISTVSSALIYYILQAPDCEEKMYSEVDDFLKRHNGEIKHEHLSELTYLNAALTETLRLVPFSSRTERVCTKDWKNEEFNLDIKKGMVIQIPIWAANRNPKYFSDPEKFDPERFLPGRKEKLHPYAFTSFGFGPRNCIAIKLSYEILLLMHLLLFKTFKFHLRNDSKPVYIPTGLLFAAHDPFYFDVTLRK